MAYDYWQVEIRRLIASVILGLIVGYATGYWLASFLVVSFGYIGWVLFKLRQLQNWLVKGQPAESMPDSDGAWEQITYLIHRSKQKSRSRKKKQKETLDRLNNVMAALPDATILINQDFIIQWSNPAATRLLGIQTQTDWGNRLDNLIRSSELNTLLRNGDTDKEIRLNSPIDSNMILQAHLVPVQKNLYLFNVRDISQGVHLQQTRKAFFANASHELRTPLTVLAGYLELFEDDAELPEHLMPAVQQARAQADRMQRIISDMLSLSKLENDEQRRMIETDIDVPELLDDIAVSLSDTLAADSHTLSLNLNRELHLLGHENRCHRCQRPTGRRRSVLSAGRRRGHRHGRHQLRARAHRQRLRRHFDFRHGRARAQAGAPASGSRPRHHSSRRPGRHEPRQQLHFRSQRLGRPVRTVRRRDRPAGRCRHAVRHAVPRRDRGRCRRRLRWSAQLSVPLRRIPGWPAGRPTAVRPQPGGAHEPRQLHENPAVQRLLAGQDRHGCDDQGRRHRRRLARRPRWHLHHAEGRAEDPRRRIRHPDQGHGHRRRRRSVQEARPKRRRAEQAARPRRLA